VYALEQSQGVNVSDIL